MYWLRPPSIVRRIAAVALVLGALVWDLRTAATESFPIAAAPIPSGTEITPDLVAWIDLPIDALPPVEPIGNMAAVAIEAGEPLTAAMLVGTVVAPEGWWTIPIAIGALGTPGDEVMLVIADPPISVVGIVITSQVGDPYDLGHRPAAVAVPPDAAPVIAAAAHQGLLVTAIRGTPAGR